MRNYTNAINEKYNTTRHGNSNMGDSPDGKSQMSKTQASQFWPAKTQEEHIIVSAQLSNYTNKLSRGVQNQEAYNQMKVAHVRELSMKKPDIEALHKRYDDKAFGVWEKYLMKAQAKQKQLRKKQKDEAKEAESKEEKLKAKLDVVKGNLKGIKQNFNEKAEELYERNEKRI